MSRKFLVTAALVLLLFVVPVLITQATRGEGRKFRGASLQNLKYTEIGFRNVEQDIDLAGMLFVPQGEGPFPAVVVIHGSGTSVRDNRWYLSLTEYLQTRGVVVLLPDKRGSEKSGGDWRSASFEDLATDTLAAVRYLSEQGAVDVSEIGIVGMSQGGWIAPLVADRSQDVAFIVSLAGAAVTPAEQLLYEENHNLRQMGFLPGISNLVALISTTVIRNGGQKEFWDAVEDYDPLPYWKALGIDALVILGSEDTNVPSATSAARLRDLQNPRIGIRVFDGSGHAIESPEGLGDSIIREDALEDILGFIEEVAASRSAPANQ